MLIDELDSLTFTVEDNDPLITIIFKNISAVEVGRFQIKKERAESFLEALKTLVRINYNVFEAHEKATVKVTDKLSGTVSF